MSNGFGPSNILSRANSDLLSISMAADDVHVTPERRMAIIVSIAEEYAHNLRVSGFAHVLERA